MGEGQIEGRGTARALYEAGNTEGAKRILGRLLEKNPDDYLSADLMVETLLNEGEAKAALEYCDNWLSRHPNAVGMHVHRFSALAKLGRKREMASSLQRFQKNFPHEQGSISMMELILDAKKGKQNSVRKRIEEQLGEVHSPELIRVKAIALHNLNDLFEADFYLSQAIEHYPNDAELLSAMATNRFQIGRLASARKFAARSLAADPTKRRMAFLSRMTWLFYYPSCYFMLIAMSAGVFLWARVNKLVALVSYMILFSLVKGAITLSFFPLIILLGISTTRAVTLFTAIAVLAYFFVVMDQFFKAVFGRKKTIKLKKY
ncbi:tetratricopeptide repeat protein [Ruegeria sp.]|uniref:tetratricopeptide repeat protein n=1 Tax=Ruegeria sp. TaxID=1879320 RepID=UPI00230B62A2|nr:tetratricopeptide repeat protein [Ruegeria sp.]MDA7967269.1 tetratricopeptide repeat protein [Ruegeria sp.]